METPTPHQYESALQTFSISLVNLIEEKIKKYHDGNEQPGGLYGWTNKVSQAVENQRSFGEKFQSIALSGVTNLFSFYGRQQRGKKIRLMKCSLKHLTDDDAIRRLLVEASINIFRCFECQLMQIYLADMECSNGLDQLAEDIVNRVMNYLHKRNVERFSCDFIYRGLLRGSSNWKFDSPRAILNFRTGGNHIQSNLNDWNTSAMINNTGVIINSAIYYDRAKNGSKYGYRLPFKFELEKWEKEGADYKHEKLSVDITTYEYFYENLNIESKVDDIINILRKQDKERILKLKEISSLVEIGICKPVESFIGRVSQLNQIQQHLKAKQIVVIYGTLGIGKSELVRKFIDEHVYDGKVWIHADNVHNIKDSFIQLAIDHLDIHIKDANGVEKSIDFIVDKVYKECSKKNYIFIFQDVMMEGIIDAFLPKKFPNIHVVITSTLTNWGRLRSTIPTIELKAFETNEATHFIEQSLEKIKPNESDIEYLAEMHENHPLYLQLAISSLLHESEILQKKFVFRDHLLKEKAQQIFEKKGLPPDAAVTPIQLKLKNCLVAIKNEPLFGEKAIEFLEMFSFCAPAPIPAKVFDKKYKNYNNVIDTLKSHSMVRTAEDTISVHRAIQQVLQVEFKHRKEEILGKLLSKFVARMMRIRNKSVRNLYIQHSAHIWESAYEHTNLIKKYIISKMRDQNVVNFFHIIVARCNINIIKKIMKCDNLVLNCRTTDSKLPIHTAAQHGRTEVVKLILEEKRRINDELNVNTPADWDFTPLHFAVQSNTPELVMLLIENGAEVDAVTNLKFTPLHLAVQAKSIEIVTILLKHKAVVNVKTTYNYTPLHFAVKIGSLDIVKQLLERKADANIATAYNVTPLHSACQFNKNVEIFDLLLKKNANTDVIDDGQFTLLHQACVHGNLKIVKKLLDIPNIISCIDKKTSKGKTALNLAEEKGFNEIVDLLKEAGAVV